MTNKARELKRYLYMAKGLVFLVTVVFSAAIFANPEVRIYNDTPSSYSKKGRNSPHLETEKSFLTDKTTKQGVVDQDDVPDKNLPLDLQIKKIDAEILLLKAELARKNGDPSSVKAYLDSLRAVDKKLLSSSMKLRVLNLKLYLQKLSSNSVDDPGESSYVFNPQSIAVLLPLTGDYAEIGLAIKQGLEEGFPDVQLKFYDTEVYDSMSELWNLLKLKPPTFIIGPLRPAKAQALNDLDTHVPTLLLNEVDSSKNYVRSFSLSRDNDVQQIIHQLVEHQLTGVKLVVGGSPSSHDLLTAFQDSWQKYSDEHPNAVKDFRIDVQYLEKRMDKTVELLVNARKSLIRKNWLQRVVEHKLHFEERSRKDLDVVISFVSAREAIQVAPLLNFYYLGSVQHYWLPSELPLVKDFTKNIGYWRNTYAFLPKYFTDAVNKFSISSEDENNQVGIFHAFGLLAAKIAESANDLKVQQLSSSLGTVVLNQRREPTLLSNEYWLNKGRISLVKLP